MGPILFFFGEAYRALRRNAAPSIAAIVTIAITVLLVGVLVPVLDASGSGNAAIPAALPARNLERNGKARITDSMPARDRVGQEIFREGGS